MDKLPEYESGIRFSSDSMDCGVPIAIDSRNFCIYKCAYCFTGNLSRNPERNKGSEKVSKELSIKRLERFLARDLPGYEAFYPLLEKRMPVQLGALSDPFDSKELEREWIKQAIPLFRKHGVPVRISTKGGNVLQRPEYLRLFENDPDMFWFAFSIICNDDDLIKKIDIKAPVTSERLKAMSLLTSLGAKASLRFRPFLPGISDTYPGGPKNAWAILLERARDAGAQAVSFEYIFLDRNLSNTQKDYHKHMFKAMGFPYFYTELKAMSHPKEKAMRAHRTYKADMTFKIRKKAHELGMTFAVSDPHFKEWGDTMCCCGFPDTGDKWFSNFSRNQMTAVIVEAHRAYISGVPWRMTFNDWKPAWAENVKIGKCVDLGSWDRHLFKKHQTVSDTFRDKWNDPEHPRGPYIYFGKVLVPTGTDEATGDLIYEYQPWV